MMSALSVDELLHAVKTTDLTNVVDEQDDQ